MANWCECQIVRVSIEKKKKKKKDGKLKRELGGMRQWMVFSCVRAGWVSL